MASEADHDTCCRVSGYSDMPWSRGQPGRRNVRIAGGIKSTLPENDLQRFGNDALIIYDEHSTANLSSGARFVQEFTNSQVFRRSHRR